MKLKGQRKSWKCKIGEENDLHRTICRPSNRFLSSNMKTRMQTGDPMELIPLVVMPKSFNQQNCPSEEKDVENFFF